MGLVDPGTLLQDVLNGGCHIFTKVRAELVPDPPAVPEVTRDRACTFLAEILSAFPVCFDPCWVGFRRSVKACRLCRELAAWAAMGGVAAVVKNRVS